MSRTASDVLRAPPVGGLLSDMPKGQACRVVAVVAPDADPQWVARLEEIGFIPGEQVRVLARAQPGGDPLSIRIGCSTFALRRVEAACVQVAPLALAAGDAR